MSHRILVFNGSYRSGRMGIRLAGFVVERLRRRGDAVELIPMLDTMYKKYPPGRLPSRLSSWRARFAIPMASYSSRGNIVGVSSRD